MHEKCESLVKPRLNEVAMTFQITASRSADFSRKRRTCLHQPKSLRCVPFHLQTHFYTTA
jgi:hypothetical protein